MRRGTRPAAILRADDGLAWFDLPGAFLSEPGIVRLRAPPRSDRAELVQRLRRGQYGKPFLFDDGENLRLHFSLRYVQSAMSIEEPDALNFPYTQMMMGFLLFEDSPRHVVQVGLGGGSLTKFCHRELPRTRLTTIEIDGDVIGLAELFRVPAPDARLRVIHGDAADYFAGPAQPADVVLIDGCDRLGVAPAFCNPGFYAHVRRHLRPGGILVVNLIGRANRLVALKRVIAAGFPGPLMSLHTRDGGNHVVFAFNPPAAEPDWRAIKQRAEPLQARHGLDFPDYARRLQRSWQSQD